MIYSGIDYPNRYSVACTLDAQGRKRHEERTAYLMVTRLTA